MFHKRTRLNNLNNFLVYFVIVWFCIVNYVLPLILNKIFIGFLIVFFFLYRLEGFRIPPHTSGMMDAPITSDIVIISGNSHPELTNLVAARLGVKTGGVAVYHKQNRETMVEIGDSVRGKDIYIIQTGSK